MYWLKLVRISYKRWQHDIVLCDLLNFEERMVDKTISQRQVLCKPSSFQHLFCSPYRVCSKGELLQLYVIRTLFISEANVALLYC